MQKLRKKRSKNGGKFPTTNHKWHQQQYKRQCLENEPKQNRGEVGKNWFLSPMTLTPDQNNLDSTR